jgi:phosphoglycolate phosphatase
VTEPVAIVFDLDGTLIDSAPDIMGIANAILDREGKPPLSLAETISFIGSGSPVFVARMRAARGLPEHRQDAVLADFIAAYDSAVTLTQIYPGVRQALTDLRAAGHTLGICTNKPVRPAERILTHLGLEIFFDIVLGGDSLAKRKPDPAPLQAALAGLGVATGLYIGDSEVDAETAQRAGTPFLLFTEGYRKSPVSDIPHAAAFDAFSDFPGLIADHTS